jgi:hypothetical protein
VLSKGGGFFFSVGTHPTRLAVQLAVDDVDVTTQDVAHGGRACLREGVRVGERAWDRRGPPTPRLSIRGPTPGKVGVCVVVSFLVAQGAPAPWATPLSLQT